MTAGDFSQYRKLMSDLAEPALRQAVRAKRDTRGERSVLLGAPAALLLVADAPGQHEALANGLRTLAAMQEQDGRRMEDGGKKNAAPPPGPDPQPPAPLLSDPLGHARDLYHPLVLHLHLAAFSKLYESLPVGLWSACEELVPRACEGVRAVEAWANRAPPPEKTALVLWESLCLHDQADLAKRDADAELVDTIVHAITARPGPGGSLHPRDEGPQGESLDAWTYRELTGLHALTNLAIARRSAAWAARVEEIALYHLNNTQPDNTTNEPWAVAGFLWSTKTRSFGEQQLHDATAHGAGEIGPVAAMLLADAANTLGAFEGVSQG
jgi:hypothetical protein